VAELDQVLLERDSSAKEEIASFESAAPGELVMPTAPAAPLELPAPPPPEVEAQLRAIAGGATLPAPAQPNAFMRMLQLEDRVEFATLLVQLALRRLDEGALARLAELLLEAEAVLEGRQTVPERRKRTST